MNPTIKARIESIRRGEVPEGYKRTKAGIMPVPWCKEKNYQAKDLFVSVSDKKHGGALEVLSATQDRGIVPRRLVDIDIKYDGSNLGTYKKVDKGDFVISLRSFQGGIEYSDYVGIVSPAYTVVRSKQKIVAGYYKAYFKTEDFIKRLNIGTYGIRDGKQVSFDDFGDMVLHYPPVNEQEKIAEILAGQDRGIALKEKLLAEKQKQKKYLMQQLLTGKKRLPGFSGKRKNFRLFDLCQIIADGDWIESKDQSDRGVRLIQTGNIGIGQFLNKFNKAHYISEETFTRLSCCEVFPGDVLLSRLPDPIGRACIIPKLNCRMITAVDCTILRFKKEVFADLFVYYSCLDAWQNKMVLLSGGSTRKRITRKEIENAVIALPIDEKEQITIAEILSTADKEIELLKKDIEQEKLKKKSLMQLLLTGIVRVDELVS